jgi:tol-pal system protein YbgF
LIRRRLTLAWLGLAPFAGACLATRDDLRIVQADLAVVRAEAARADSARGRQLEAIAQGVARSTDSLQALIARLARWRADDREELLQMQQQLITIQELTGQSQRRLQELRAGLEERALEVRHPEAVPATVPPTGAGTPPNAGAPAATPPTAPAGPGPNQLLQLALDQLRRGSTGSARAAFQDIVTQHATSDVAPLAQFYVAESWAQEGKAAEADSVYLLVASRYPASEKAPTALYKHGLSLATAGKADEARRVFRDVVQRYPRSDEAVLAGARLREPR